MDLVQTEIRSGNVQLDKMYSLYLIQCGWTVRKDGSLAVWTVRKERTLAGWTIGKEATPSGWTVRKRGPLAVLTARKDGPPRRLAAFWKEWATSQKLFLSFLDQTEYTVNKGLAISCPQPGCHLPNSPWPGIICPIPAPERFGQRKSRNLAIFFYSVDPMSLFPVV